MYRFDGYWILPSSSVLSQLSVLLCKSGFPRESWIQRVDGKGDKLLIGSLTLSNNTVLAPLAGITNLPFRLMAKASGCGLVCSEMISANGLVYQSSKPSRC